MKCIKNILKSSLYTVVFFIIFSFFITVLNYFNLFDYKIINILKIVIPIISVCFGGYIIGKNSLKNGWLEGLKLSSFLSIFLVVISFISNSFKLSFFIYILILIFSCMFGGALGINKK